ncbi:hypothetical protein GCM10022236_10170 [Microlunatus ginsengisoli]|uniref:Uncharacterized protein n=1 Tax=Microlunatus ginsengisoli TaxID=363863 RepID=A0ABP6ZI32_9ACTN
MTVRPTTNVLRARGATSGSPSGDRVGGAPDFEAEGCDAFVGDLIGGTGDLNGGGADLSARGIKAATETMPGTRSPIAVE